MNTLIAFTMTPTEPMITILAGTLIIAGVALLIMFRLLHEARHEREQAIKNAMTWTEEANGLKKELEYITAKRNAIEDELTTAKSEIEWQLVRWKQKSESKEYWKGIANKAADDIEQWKALYLEQLNRANHLEELHTRMTKRPRDPKTGRIISKSKAVIAEAFNDPEVVKRGDEIRAFEAMMGNAIDKLNGLRVRNLCAEVKANAIEDVKAEND